MMLTKIFKFFFNPSPNYSAGVLLLFGCAGGIVLWGGFNWAVESTNNLKFCISCHEMTWVYEEYKNSAHYSNPSGVRAICSDCHVPKDWGAKMARKIKATYIEIPRKLIGKINTKEKFEAHRLELAKNVWSTMKENDSRECRNCHSQESMELEGQDKSARKKHTMAYMTEKNKTCIDCHKGIAHELPEDYE